MTDEIPHNLWESEKKKMITKLFYTYGKNFDFKENSERAKIYVEVLEFYKPEVVEIGIRNAIEENISDKFNRNYMPQAFHIEKHCGLIQTGIDNREPEIEKPQDLTQTDFAGELDREFGEPGEND